jgi:hypothetical protein
MAACNNAGDKAAGTDTTAAAKDTTMQMAQDSAKSAVPSLPAVPAGAKVYFKNLKNGQSVTSPVKVEMGVDGMKVDTAGPVVANSGHFHILIDAAGDSIPTGQIIVKDSTHLHYGKAQTSAELKLAPGTHTLSLEFADGLHRSYGSQMAATVSVTVKK